MVKKVTMIAMVFGLLLSSGLLAQAFEGVYQLEIEDYNGKVISRGTGFYVKQDKNATPYVLTSFHLLNARLLEAAKIRISSAGKNIYLKIASYDELNDVLVLSSSELTSQPLLFADDCNGKMEVLGFHEGKFLTRSVENGMENTEIDSAKKLDVYLSKGFSGAPLLNDNAEICGMVALSSEYNASSIAVSSEVLKATLGAISTRPFSVREFRVLVGVEKVVRTQEDLDRLMLDTGKARQIIIGLAPADRSQRFIIKEMNNAIVDAYSDISKLVVHHSRNVMLRNINAERIMINESVGVTITGCMFATTNQALLLKDSSDLYVKGNMFKNIATGIVLKSSAVDEKSLSADNIFVSVNDRIQNI